MTGSSKPVRLVRDALAEGQQQAATDAWTSRNGGGLS